MIQTAKPSARKGVIRRLREAKGWSQQALADKAVVSFKTISSLEQGKRAQLSTFRKVADKLGVEPGELIEQDDPAPPPDTPPATLQDKRVRITLTLSIPFQDFDETEGIDLLSAFVRAVINGKNAIAITDVVPSSVKLTMLVDEDDVPRLLRAFVDRKLDQIQASELTVPRKGALYNTDLAILRAEKPVIGPAPPSASYMLIDNRSHQSGIDVELTGDDFLTLKRNPQATTSISYGSIPIVVAGHPSSIQQAIDDIIPQYLIPRFPGSITLRLEPDEDGTDSSITLGERLESLLSSHESLRSKMSRPHTTPDWSGDIAITLDTVDELRAMSEGLLAGFLGQPVTLAVTGTYLGGQFTVKKSLSGPEWNSVIEELAELHKRKLKSISLGLTPP